MARITGIVKIEKVRNSIRSDSECTYSVFYCDGDKYFQIETYGSKERQVKNQPSQNIQFNKELAAKLINILKKEFDI